MVDCKAGVLPSNRKRRYRRVELKYSLSKPRTGARTSLQSGSLVPSDCHWAVFLDDIVVNVRFYCSDSGINMLLWGGQSVVGEKESVSPGGRFS
jgi:hypothetical protein